MTWRHVADGPGVFTVKADRPHLIAYCDAGETPGPDTRVYRGVAGTERIVLYHKRRMFIRSPGSFTVEAMG